MFRTKILPCILLGLAVASSSTLPAQPLGTVIENVERHYNRLSSLRMEFEQSMEFAGQKRSSERGTLYLQRPGKMRWDYAQPEGKVAVGDGKIFRIYNPLTNQVRQVELEAMTDLRAPLSFLLGRMRIRRMFRNLRLEEADGKQVLTGEGRQGQDFYSRVEFDLDPQDSNIEGIRIFGLDDSVNVYRFSAENANPRLAAELFVFQAPPGAEVLPLTSDFNDLAPDSRGR